MARASYQRIDNIRIGTKPVNVKLVKKSHKSVTVCPTPSVIQPPSHKNGPYRPMLHLKV